MTRPAAVFLLALITIVCVYLAMGHVIDRSQEHGRRQACQFIQGTDDC